MDYTIPLNFAIPLEILQKGDVKEVQEFLCKELKSKLAVEKMQIPVEQDDRNAQFPCSSASSATVDSLGALLLEMQKIREQNSVLKEKFEKLLSAEETNHRSISEKLAQNEESVAKLRTTVETAKAIADTTAVAGSSKDLDVVETLKKAKAESLVMPDVKLIKDIEENCINTRQFSKFMDVDVSILNKQQLKEITEKLLLCCQTMHDTEKVLQLLKNMYKAVMDKSDNYFGRFLGKRICHIFKKRKSVTRMTSRKVTTEESAKMCEEIMSIIDVIGFLYTTDVLNIKFIDTLLAEMEYTPEVIKSPKSKGNYNSDALNLVTALLEEIKDKLLSEVEYVDFIHRLAGIAKALKEEPHLPSAPTEVTEDQQESKMMERLLEATGNLAQNMSDDENDVLYKYFCSVKEDRTDEIDTLNFMVLGNNAMEELIAMLWKHILDNEHSNKIPFSTHVVKKIMTKLSMNYEMEVKFLESLEKQAKEQFSARSKECSLSFDLKADKRFIPIHVQKYKEMLKVMGFIGALFTEGYVSLDFVRLCLEEIQIESLIFSNSYCWRLVSRFAEIIEEKLIEADVEYLFYLHKKIQNMETIFAEENLADVHPVARPRAVTPVSDYMVAEIEENCIKGKHFAEFLEIDYSFLNEFKLGEIAEKVLLAYESKNQALIVFELLKKMYSTATHAPNTQRDFAKFLKRKILGLFIQRREVTKIIAATPTTPQAIEMHQQLSLIIELIGRLYNFGDLSNDFIESLLEQMEFTDALVRERKFNGILNNNAVQLITSLFEQMEPRILSESESYWFVCLIKEVREFLDSINGPGRTYTEPSPWHILD